jgi:hypothetical protein
MPGNKTEGRMTKDILQYKLQQSSSSSNTFRLAAVVDIDHFPSWKV